MAPMMRHGGVTAVMLLGLVLAPVAVWGVDPACPADAAPAGHVNVLLQDDGSTVLDSSGPAIPPMTSSASASWGEAAPCDYDGEVVVGGVLSLNPDDTFAAYGVTIRRCMQIFIDWLNTERGGLQVGNQRYSMRWVWIDDGSGVQQTMSAVANVVRRHNVDFVWGGYASGLCKFTARQAYQEDKLCLCGAAASPTAFSENNLTYGALPPDVHYIINSLRAIKSGAQSADTQGAATQPSDPLQPGFCGDAGCEASLKVGVLYADPLVGMCANVYTEASDLGYSVAPGFSYAAGAMPKEPSAEQVDAVLTQMIDNEINVVIGCTYHSTCKAVSEGLERLNFSPLAIAFTSCVDSPYFAADVHSGWYPGEYIMGVSPYHVSNPTRGDFSGLTSSEFLQRYVDRYKSTPSYHGPSHFALACALAKAIEDAGAVDTQSVKAALDQLSLQEFAFANPIEFTEELYGQNDPVMLVIQYARETSGDPSAAEVIVFPENAVTVGQMHFPNPPWEMRRCRALGAGSTLQDRQDPVTLALKMRRVRDNGGECSGHGLCVADGTCACDDDWQGENCEESSLITECPVNTYAIQFDPLVCRVCPDGSVSEPGSVSEHDCTPRMEVEWQDCEPCKTFGPTEGEDACERCPKGYELGVNGSKYVDFDECTVNNGDCDPLAVPICTNLVGSYQCGSCPSGFVGDGDVGCELPAVHHDVELDIMFAAVIPTATLAATADSAILDNPTNYMNSIQGLLADALNVSTTAVTISNVRQADSGGDNGRRLQQSVSVLFDVGVAGPDASTAMRMLYSKLQDSQFCEATSITEGQQIAVVPSCPPGLYRPESQILCTECPWNHYLQDGGCVECPFLTTVNRDPLTVDEMPCVCQAGMFDISSTAVRGAFCFELDFFEDPFSETSVFNHYRTDKDKGLLCSYCPECMDCNAHPGMITVIPGWKTVDTGPDAMTATTQNISVMSRLGLTAEVSALICPYPDSCLGDTVVNGTVISKCASGFTGHLCAACAEGYTFTKVGCEECTTQGLLVLPLVCVGILILSLFYAEFEQWFAENGQHYQNLFFEGKRLVVPISKILVTTAQIIGSLPITMDFIFPDSMTAFIDFLRVFAVDVFLILRTNCLLGNSFYVKFATTFLIPVIVAVFLFAYSAWKARQHKMPEVGGLSLKQRKHLLDEYESLAARGGPEDNQVTASDIAGCCEDLDVDMSHEEIDTIMRNADKDADGHISFEEFVHILHEGSGKFPELIGAFEMRRHMQSVNAMVSVIVFLLYPGVCQTAFSALRCRDLAPGLSVLLQDYTIDCNSEEYQIFRIVAIVAILLGPVGIPVGAYLKLKKNEAKILARDRDTLREFNALVGDYEPEYYYWECIELGRKLVLAGFIMFVVPGSSIQIAVAAAVTFGFFAVSMRYTPFEHKAHDIVKALSEITVFMVLLSVMLMKPALAFAQQDRLGHATVVCVTSLTALIAFFTFKAARDIVQTIRHDMRSLEDRASTMDLSNLSSPDLTKEDDPAGNTKMENPIYPDDDDADGEAADNE